VSDAASQGARAFWIAAPGRGELRDEPLPACADGQVQVRSLYSGISRGTESLIFGGGVPESQYAAMRAPFQAGDFPGPVKYGYSNVGVVERGPAALLGREVFCLFPHQDRYVVPAEAVVPLPEGLPAARAVLAANAETAVNVLWDAPPLIGERLAVIGAGVVGCLIAALAARVPGASVQLIDIDQRRAAVAEALGVDFASPEAARGEVDRVYHTSASAAGLATALRLAAFEAEVIEVSWYGNREVPVPLGEAFHSRRLTIRASQVGAVAPRRRGAISHAGRMALALQLLLDLRFEALISGDCRFEELPQALDRLSAQPDGALCIRVHYD
jgi:threonine dehydrogenase-like Zn-dependent dehydrogenase